MQGDERKSLGVVWVAERYGFVEAVPPFELRPTQRFYQNLEVESGGVRQARGASSDVDTRVDDCARID